jgi:hypothetical protein
MPARSLSSGALTIPNVGPFVRMFVGAVVKRCRVRRLAAFPPDSADARLVAVDGVGGDERPRCACAAPGTCYSGSDRREGEHSA